MTDYLPYTWGEYAVDAPATALHFERWFRNWEAGFEGAANAPRLQDYALGPNVTDWGRTWVGQRLTASWVGVRMAETGPAWIGTYAYLEYYGSSGGASVRWPGDLVAGSSLRWAGGSNLNSGNPDGTWRCMGKTGQRSSNNGVETAATTLWQRIA